MIDSKRHSLDRIDYRILDILQSDARISNNKLAGLVHLSPSACLSRVRQLHEKGYIVASRAQLDLTRLCRHVIVLCTITLKDHSQKNFKNFEKSVLKIPELVECNKISGQFDYLLRFICTDMDSYHAISEKLLDGDTNIANLYSHVVLDQTKTFVGYPLAYLKNIP